MNMEKEKNAPSHQKPERLFARISEIEDHCLDCPKCKNECAFLARYGTPKAIVQSGGPADPEFLTLAYECSLCGLCGEVCPVGLRPDALFREMRRAAVAGGARPLKAHGPILAYENRGMSRRYTWYSLPEGSDTVFFPGCTLTGTRPDKTIALYEHLKTVIPGIGIVLDCCGKPSHDLGRTGFFQDMLSEMKTYLAGKGIRRVITACPNCQHVFAEYGESIAAVTVYEILLRHGMPETGAVDDRQVTIHDPCVFRHDADVHSAVRRLLEEKGFAIKEMPHNREKTLCCGEGGAVGSVDRELSAGWRSRRQKEADGRPMLTCCAGCANFLKGPAPVFHLIDAVFDPEGVARGSVKVSRAPLTYLNRLRLKRRLRKSENAVTREREYRSALESGEKKSVARWLVPAAIAALIVALHLSGASRYLEADQLRGWVASWGRLAPVIYMLIYTVAPALFLPGLPITIAGGILFGPVWGVAFAITGATAGACLAFLISRYVARDCVRARMRTPRWKRLDDGVEKHGWKIVAFTRLIPLFPFNMLNYAFGITRVRFFDYAVTSFFCMLPACVAFIVFSSSLLDLVRGRVSIEFVVGIALIAGVSLMPLMYRRYWAKTGIPD